MTLSDIGAIASIVGLVYEVYMGIARKKGK